jgi:hypothetical protein
MVVVFIFQNGGEPWYARSTFHFSPKSFAFPVFYLYEKSAVDSLYPSKLIRVSYNVDSMNLFTPVL